AHALAAELMRLAEIAHGVFHVGVGIVEAGDWAAIAHHLGGRGLDLHEADLAGPAPRVDAVVALDAHDGVGELHRHAIGVGVFGNDAVDAPARLVDGGFAGRGYRGGLGRVDAGVCEFGGGTQHAALVVMRLPAALGDADGT